MEEDLTSCKRVSSGKQVVSCDALCLQEDICRMPTLQGPPSSGSDGVTTKKPTSKVSNLSSAEEDGLKKGTWKRAHPKFRAGLVLPLNNVLGLKRSSKEISRETEKAELAKMKTKVSNNEGLHVLSGEDQITSAEVATQPHRAL